MHDQYTFFNLLILDLILKSNFIKFKYDIINDKKIILFLINRLNFINRNNHR